MKDPHGANVKEGDDDELFRSESAFGVSRVICYHPDSSKRLAVMTVDEIYVAIKEAWINEMRQLRNDFDWIQVFENRGAAVGCSNMHPHCQLWASQFIPTIPLKKHINQKEYFDKHGKVMLVEYHAKELVRKERIVDTNEHWTVLVPYWAYWPFELMILPTRHVLRLDEINEEEIRSLSIILQRTMVRYDNIFKCDFPFVFGWQSAPTGRYLKEDCSFWQLHAVIYPPLLRSATVKKFMAGYELIAEPQRDITPEQAAETIRSQPTVHYSKDTLPAAIVP
ncbi:Galactose-1-phosphate uridyl transferase [Aphelenchoides avenae]|nr:Galactose-1-phosphate uridyl transferase [Aphelenchus avenae]